MTAIGRAARVLHVVLACTFPSCALAAIYYVAPGSSIQQQVDLATVGDTIVLETGHFFETVIPYGKDLTIGSRFLLDGDTAHVSATIAEPDELRPDTASCFVYAYNETPASRLSGLTIRNGRGTAWGTHRLPMGGGVHIAATAWYPSSASIDHCRVESSQADYGGGIGISGVRYLFYPEVIIRDTDIRECVAGYGGGVFARHCSLTVDRTMFEDDSAEAHGAGLYLSSPSAILSNSFFQGCSGLGAVACINSSGLISDCIFSENYNYTAVGSSHLFVSGGRMTVTRSCFRAGRVKCPVYLGDSNSRFQFVGNVLEDNESAEIAGVIETDERSYGTIAYNIIRNNEFVVGGAIYAFSDANCRIHHNIIARNRSWASNDASVLKSATFARPQFDSNWVSGNEGNTISYLAPYPVTIDARNNWWGHPSGPYQPTLNPAGQGDTLLNDSVLFIPWLTEPPDTTMPLTIERGRDISPATWELAAVYPNPFNSMMTIVIAGFTKVEFTLALYNLLGQEVASLHRGPLTGGSFSFQAPPELASGLYLLRAADADQIRTAKVILLR